MERPGYWLHKWTDETSSFDPHGRWSGGLECYERDYSMWIPDRIKPDDTVTVNDYIDKQFELSVEVADGLEVIEAADAQATIAALQAQLATCFKLSGADPDGNEDWRLAPHAVEEVTRLRNDYDELGDETEALREQLTQRTAELEAANKLLYKKNCALGRAETIINDLQAELERVRADNKALDKWRADVTVSLQRPEGAFFVDVPQHIKDLVKERDELRTLVLALPKVEGGIVAQAGYVKDQKKVYACFGSYADMTAYAALLQHRQGMEG